MADGGTWNCDTGVPPQLPHAILARAGINLRAQGSLCWCGSPLPISGGFFLLQEVLDTLPQGTGQSQALMS